MFAILSNKNYIFLIVISENWANNAAFYTHIYVNMWLGLELLDKRSNSDNLENWD